MKEIIQGYPWCWESQDRTGAWGWGGADREEVENHGSGREWVPKKVAGSVRKLAGAGNLSDSSLGLGRVSHLCSELGREVPFRLETAAEWEFPQRAGALTQANGSGHWGKQKETQLLLKREIGRSEKLY